jgi:hypothetical protein
MFAAELPPTHTDESKVPAYTLPDPLIFQNGQKVETVKQWTEQRRAEIFKLFEENVYGRSPRNNGKFAAVKMITECPEAGPAFNGKAVRYQFALTFYTGERPAADSPVVDFLLYVPKVKSDTDKFPVFLGLNFQGNHTTTNDPEVLLRRNWNRDTGKYVLAKEEERGLAERRWCYEKAVERGYAVGTAHCWAFEPDFNGGRKLGVRRLMDKDGEELAAEETNTLGTWAWGLTKLLDAVCEQNKEGTLRQIDTSKAAVFGHSRLGKASLWAGAIEPRFAMVISNDSGCGGAALSRRAFGETVARINTVFPHWFCGNFKKYNGKEGELPVDQHELIALIAPRPVYVASASEDLWADPKGEFLSALNADPVYRLLGTEGFGNVKEQPGVNQSVGGRIRYHLREGKHDIVEFDWLQYFDFAERYL